MKGGGKSGGGGERWHSFFFFTSLSVLQTQREKHTRTHTLVWACPVAFCVGCTRNDLGGEGKKVNNEQKQVNNEQKLSRFALTSPLETLLLLPALACFTIMLTSRALRTTPIQRVQPRLAKRVAAPRRAVAPVRRAPAPAFTPAPRTPLPPPASTGAVVAAASVPAPAPFKWLVGW